MQTYEGEEVQFRAFLISALEMICQRQAPVDYLSENRTRHRLDPRAGLEFVSMRRIVVCPESNSGLAARS
jgi:hypothetical protein